MTHTDKVTELVQYCADHDCDEGRCPIYNACRCHGVAGKGISWSNLDARDISTMYDVLPQATAAEPPKPDAVSHPSHYCKGGIECIDVIRAAISDITDPFEAYCTGNIIKYAFRWHGKGGKQDLRKAVMYANMITEGEHGSKD